MSKQRLFLSALDAYSCQIRTKAKFYGKAGDDSAIRRPRRRSEEETEPLAPG
jgi:hypothetical protein